MSKGFDFRWGVPLLDEQPGYAKVYEFMLDRYAEVITRDEFLCIIHLARYHYNSKKGKSRPALDTIAKQMGYAHKNSISRHVQSLEAKGMIAVIRRPGLTSVYNAAPFTLHMMALAGITPEGVTSQCGGTPQRDGVSHPSVPEEENKKRNKEKEGIITFDDLEAHPNSIKSNPAAPVSKGYKPAVADPHQDPPEVEELARQLAPPIDLVWGYDKATNKSLLHAARELIKRCKGGDIGDILEALDTYLEKNGDWARDHIGAPMGLVTLVATQYQRMQTVKARQATARATDLGYAERSQATLAERQAERTPATPEEIRWGHALEELEPQMGGVTFQYLFGNTRLRSASKFVAVVEVGSEGVGVREKLEFYWGDQVAAALGVESVEFVM